jgi:predicted  nucleic acid-binding Zn-ribbon protein
MAHVCATCGYKFEKASKEMLSGCPDCGGNKFQYQPHDDAAIIDSTVETTPAQPSAPEEDAQSAARSDILEPDDEDIGYTGSASELIAGLQNAHEAAEDEEEGEGPDVEENAPSPPPVREEPSPERMAALRRELNDQFESIRILEPGMYELNLERLVERDEYIIQIYEDGCYAIQMPERHMGRVKDE